MERIGYESTPTPVSSVCVKEKFGCLSTPDMCMIFLFIDRFGYVSTSTHVSIICIKERLGCLSTPALVYVISVDEEVWLFEYSYSCVY